MLVEWEWVVIVQKAGIGLAVGSNNEVMLGILLLAGDLVVNSSSVLQP